MMNTQEIPTLEQAELTLRRHCPLVKCGQEVLRGERLATSSTPGMGDVHSPVTGTVTHVDSYRIRVKATGEATVEPEDLTALAGQQLYDTLLSLGADLPPLADVATLIINGADADPGINIRSQLFPSCPGTLEHGVETISSLYKPQQAILTVLKGFSGTHTLGGLHQIEIDATYPAGLDPLVAKAVTGREAPEDTLVIGMETVFHVGRIMETGLPVMETPVTVAEKLHIVPLGMPVAQVLAMENITAADGDRIVLGSFLRGEAAALPTQGVDRKTTGVLLVKNPSPVAEDTACVGCGECVRHCPARLDPAMITSYAEFGEYQKAAAEHVDVCFECGMCGYFCLAHRPMLQYIRLAKSELAMSRSLEEVAS